MAHDERATTSDSGDPDPAVTAGLEDGGAIRPHDTPPVADSMSGTTNDNRGTSSNVGPVSGNRTPMIVALVALAIMTVMVAVFVGAALIPS